MPFATFQKTLEIYGHLFKKKNRRILIGGGEPTIHPEFWKILGYAMSYTHTWLATNGKKTDDALALCRLAKKGKLGATLSLDNWHEPIDEKVIQAFKKNMTKSIEREYCNSLLSKKKKDQREVRTINKPFYGGRWKDTEYVICCCKRVIVKPDGLMKLCACEDSPVVGTVEEGIYEKFKYVPLIVKKNGSCYKDYIIDENGYYIPPKKNNK